MNTKNIIAELRTIAFATVDALDRAALHRAADELKRLTREDEPLGPQELVVDRGRPAAFEMEDSIG